MKEVVLNIPDNKYLAFIKHLKNNFTDIQIKENKSRPKEDISEEGNGYDTILLSEKSLAEDWLSDEDKRWDEVL